MRDKVHLARRDRRTRLLAARRCGGSGSSSAPAATVSQGSPHYQTDVALCGDSPANMDWGTVQAKLGGATPALADLVSAWYGDYGTQQTMQVTGDASGGQSMAPKVVVDGVAVAVWCRKNGFYREFCDG
jgi:hypothetical protein